MRCRVIRHLIGIQAVLHMAHVDDWQDKGEHIELFCLQDKSGSGGEEEIEGFEGREMMEPVSPSVEYVEDMSESPTFNERYFDINHYVVLFDMHHKCMAPWNAVRGGRGANMSGHV